jgi:hypothetical protein
MTADSAKMTTFNGRELQDLPRKLMDEFIAHSHARQHPKLEQGLGSYRELYQNLKILNPGEFKKPGYVSLEDMRKIDWQDTCHYNSRLGPDGIGPSLDADSMQRIVTALFNRTGYAPPVQYTDGKPQFYGSSEAPPHPTEESPHAAEETPDLIGVRQPRPY